MEQEKGKNNKVITIFIVLAIIVVGYFYFTKAQNGIIGGEKTTTASFEDNGQQLSEDIINCEFKTISDFVYKNGKEITSDKDRKVYYNTSEGKPNLITFAGLSTKEPKIKGNMGDSPLTILKNDTETVVLVEQNAFGDMFTYTIFKKEKVAVWHKAYTLVATPYALLSMGYCY